jgi:hypothetical protein
MMTLLDKSKYQKYRMARTTWTRSEIFLIDILLPCLLFGSIGAMTWAIRGTNGWGGFEGTVISGMTWGLLWFYIMYLRGIDGRSVFFWLGLGISIGGMFGYGPYVSWIQGNFSLNGAGNTRYINPIIGYVWFWLCGAAWGGIGGIFLGWSLGKKVSLKKWIIRLGVPTLFSGIVILIYFLIPSLFNPFYSPNLYTESICHECVDIFETNLTIFFALMWWIGALIVAFIEKDDHTKKYGLILGIFFGLGFTLSAMWTLGNVWAPGYIDWWKIWELSTGFFGGCIYVLILYLTQKNIDLKYDINGELINSLTNKEKKHDRNNNFFYILGLASLLLVMYYGATYRMGIIFGLYDEVSIDQYEFPVPRIILLIPGVIIIILYLIMQYRQISKKDSISNFHHKVINILCYISLFGVISIWPSKILVFYLVFIWLAIYAILQIEKKYEDFKREI